jgi:hypothetical protein
LANREALWIPDSEFCILNPVSRFRLARLLYVSCYLSFVALAACDFTKGRLVGDTGLSSTESEKTNYPPSHLSEQTFVFTSPMGYESKHFATAEETKIALKLTESLEPGAHRFVAIPIAAAKGNSTTAEVMVYDTRRQTLVGDSVYRLANTPALGQTLKLDDITAIFESPTFRE